MTHFTVNIQPHRGDVVCFCGHGHGVSALSYLLSSGRKSKGTSHTEQRVLASTGLPVRFEYRAPSAHYILARPEMVSAVLPELELVSTAAFQSHSRRRDHHLYRSSPALWAAARPPSESEFASECFESSPQTSKSPRYPYYYRTCARHRCVPPT